MATTSGGKHHRLFRQDREDRQDGCHSHHDRQDNKDGGQARQTGQTSEGGLAGQTDLTFKLDFPGNLCRAAFGVFSCYFFLSFLQREAS